MPRQSFDVRVILAEIADRWPESVFEGIQDTVCRSVADLLAQEVEVKADEFFVYRDEASAADAIVTSGGVSVGDHDYMKPIMSELGTIDFWAIAIRPGRPLAFGELRDGDRRVPVFGLPGNVVSSLVTFELFVRPALLRMQGRDEVARPRTKARLLEPIEKIASLRVFARGIHDPSAGTVRTTGPQGSGILRSLSLANCLIDLPEGRARHEAGEQVDVILTEQPEPR